MTCAIPQYCYSPLSKAPDSIRLLRLVPNENERADAQCELFVYSLQESDKATHPYEALSYVWGSLDKRQSIFIVDQSFAVTPNLHAALLRLRDRDITRIIWVDAVCINQADGKEKAHQIQSMAKIYGKASRVIVWLGETVDDSDGTLEAIRAAGKKSRNSSNKIIQQAITSLLQRQWFRRIWALQEMAAARHILTLCGPTEIDGYAFCSGLELLKGFRGTRSDLGAIFRPKKAWTRSGRVSLDICSLGELIDISDDFSAVDLLPDYRVPWKELLQGLVKFLLGKQVSVKTWNDKEVAEIRSRGSVLGQVSWTESDWDGRQNTSAKSVRKGDVVCLLKGAPKPTIIRPYEDHFAVIMIAFTPPENIRIKTFPRNFLLVWDWEKSPGRGLWGALGEGDEIQVTERVVVEIARRFDKEVVALLVDRKGDEIQITGVVKAAVGNKGSEILPVAEAVGYATGMP
ncbi:HET-domain-containing protein [Zopfia rhizophila CBS 207.26]|uniref:HET-domain-containing protein n=1 Tax=Zopfia rhizophila CBS 207.26 TaxID=1314779 RepID=A0A6A6EDP9_9PEZI|nr:HET-domain-containing protein [Zopfia rhizophila CBS 207.26]